MRGLATPGAKASEAQLNPTQRSALQRIRMDLIRIRMEISHHLPLPCVSQKAQTHVASVRPGMAGSRRYRQVRSAGNPATRSLLLLGQLTWVGPTGELNTETLPAGEPRELNINTGLLPGQGGSAVHAIT